MDIKSLTTETLLQWYANAKSTSSCGGHFKGERNDELYRSYALELRSRGIMVPKNISESIDYRDGKFMSNTIIPDGVFNGEGSF
jgi:hypothetical protein